MTWPQWAEQLGDPSVTVDPKVAQKLAAACSALLEEFRSMKIDLSELTDTAAMGTLQSGIDLGRKFSLKAVGGEDSLEKSLRSHIDVVTEMRDFFQKCVDRYESIDAANAAAYVATEIPR